jgi:succinoglycan biosynthesis transport protein ExoP
VAMNTEIAVIRSRSLALRVAAKLGLENDAEFQAKSFAPTWLRRLLGLSVGPETNGDAKQAEALHLDRAAEILQKKLEAESVPFSYILRISASSGSAGMAQRLATAVADDYLSGQREAREEALQRVVVWLRSRLEDLQGRIQAEETSIAELKTTNGLTDIAGKGNLTEQQINDLSAQLMRAQDDVAEKRAHLDQANRVLEGKGDLQEVPEIVASNAIGQLRLQASQLSSQAARLRSDLGPNHEAVIAVQNQLSAVNKAISDESTRVVGDLKNAYDSALQREQSLEASLQKLSDKRQNSTASLKLQELERLVDSDRKIYGGYLSQFNELSKSGNLQGESARIISAASLPIEPSSPRSIIYYAVGAIGGLGLGAFLAFLLEYLDRGIRSGSQVEQTFGYPLLGIIPLQGTGTPVGPTGLAQTMIESPLSKFGEAVRNTRLSLTFANHGESPKVILVTSSVPGEGKSASAMLLATSSARSGQRTVLVDCDLRHPSLSEAFGMPKRGLTDVLAGTAGLDEVVIHDRATGVDFISVGTDTQDATDFLASERMRNLVVKLRERYDYIALDAAPLLPVIDALTLASMVDKVLMVVEWGRTPRDAVFEALSVLRPESHRIAGVVLNKVDPKHMSRYGYNYGYGYSYGFGYRHSYG